MPTFLGINHSEKRRVRWFAQTQTGICPDKTKAKTFPFPYKMASKKQIHNPKLKSPNFYRKIRRKMHSQFPLFIFSIIFLLQFHPIFGDNLENIHKFKNAGELKEALMAWISLNNDFFDAGMGNAVFWSGKRRESAEGWARQNGKSILEMTRGGKILEKLNLFKAPANAVLTAKEALEVWGKASALFAEQAKGDVHVFSTGTTVVNPRGHIRTWFRIEEHILMCNKNVENIYRMKKDGKLMQRKTYKKPNCNLEKLLEIYENEENIPEHLRNWPGAEKVQK